MAETTVVTTEIGLVVLLAETTGTLMVHERVVWTENGMAVDWEMCSVA
jgi:hypothetical protein